MTALPARVGRSYTRQSYAEDGALYATRGRRLWLASVLIGLVVFPFFATGFSINVASLIGLAVLGSLALNLLTGTAGQISLGNAAFMAVGAFTAGALSQEAGLPFLVTLVVGTVISGAVGLLIGIPALRLRGLYLIIATLALHFVVIYILRRYQSDSVGPSGFRLSDPAMSGWKLDSVREWYYVITAFAVVFCAAAHNMVEGRFGRVWASIRDVDVAAEILGVDVARYKLLVFVATSVMIGIQGVLTAYFVGVVEVDSFTLELSIRYIAMILIGGLGSVLGSVLGAMFVTGLPFVVRELVAAIPADFPAASVLRENVFQVEVALYGLSIIIFVLLEPEGLAQIWRRMHRWLRLWPFSSEGALDG